MSEKERINKVFDNFYYDGFSITNKKNPLLDSTIVDIFNDHVLTMLMMQALVKAEKLNMNEYKFFDAGCGNGRMMRKFCELGIEPENCFGKDVSNEVIEFAKHNSPSVMNYSVGDISELETFDNHTFDIIGCFGVLIHVLDDDYIRKIANEFDRVLKKDGIIFVTVTDNAKWPEGMQTFTRNVPIETMKETFKRLNFVGCFNAYSDGYDQENSGGEILDLIMSGKKETSFKLLIFQK
jgi:2-polyprenyl-3-methyl-5-hydroxy-6-metoxy-1,4-benzoquinol methylase